MDGLAQTIVNGVLLGGIYAAVGVGLSMMFGIVKMVNLAHGDFLIFASYLALTVVSSVGIDPYLALVMVAPVMFGMGYLVQRGLFNLVLGKGLEPPLIVAFGLSVIIRNALLTVFTPDARSLPTPLAAMGVRLTDSLSVPAVYLAGFSAGVVLILLMHLFFRKTDLGRAIRAAADDAEVAGFMGIDTRKVYGLAMGVAMVTAAVAGVLVGTTFAFYPHTGPQYMLIAFGVVIIGGSGSMAGTLVGGVILGLAQLLGAHFFGAGYQLFFGYLVILMVLAVRPRGILARRQG